jgi:hypothetical protein
VIVRVTVDRDGLTMVVESIVLVTVPCGGVIVTITVDALEVLSVRVLVCIFAFFSIKISRVPLRTGSVASPTLGLRLEVDDGDDEAEGDVCGGTIIAVADSAIIEPFGEEIDCA